RSFRAKPFALDRLGRGLAALAAPAARLLGRRAGGAEVVHVVRVLDQSFVEVVAHLLAGGADEVDALDGLVDALAVQDAPLELLDANAEQLFVLALDLPAASLVLRKLFLAVFHGLLFVVEDRERLGLRAWLVRFAGPRHGGTSLPYADGSAGTLRVAARLLANPEEPARTESGVLDDATLGAT